jgi:hypothetical protein
MDVRTGALAIALIFSPSAYADLSACKEARETYRDALQQLSHALQDYTQCLNLGRGEDDCGVTFIDVESAQKAIEDAVAKIKGDCRQAD